MTRLGVWFWFWSWAFFFFFFDRALLLGGRVLGRRGERGKGKSITALRGDRHCGLLRSVGSDRWG